MGDLIRVVKSGNYSLISNYHLKDKRLSWCAKGILSTMLAFSGEYTIDELEGLSYKGIYDTDEFAELEQYGYLIWKMGGVDVDSGCSLLECTVYEMPISKHSSSNPVAEIMDPEDMPASSEDIDEEEKQKLREHLAVDKLEKRYSKNFVEIVFRELCRKDADFRKMMTAQAFEKVCSAVWYLWKKYGTNSRICEIIGTAFDNVIRKKEHIRVTDFRIL